MVTTFRASSNKGGKFGVMQAEVAPGHWDMTVMGVDMKGKVLLFKTISAQQTENRRDFHRVPDDLTMAQAADLLNREIVVVSKVGQRSLGSVPQVE